MNESQTISEPVPEGNSKRGGPRASVTNGGVKPEKKVAGDRASQNDAPVPDPDSDGLPMTVRVPALAALLGIPVVVLALTWPLVDGGIADRILFCSFVVFAVGLAELFLLLIALAVLGKIQLAAVFQDKENLPLDAGGSKDQESRFVRAVAGRGTVSLSRLQAFLWTLVVMTTYFHRAVTHQGEGLPSIPADLLLVMGISSAVYLTSKQMGVQRQMAPTATGRSAPRTQAAARAAAQKA